MCAVPSAPGTARRPSMADYVKLRGARGGRPPPDVVHVDYPPVTLTFVLTAAASAARKEGYKRAELSEKCLEACCSRQFCLDADGVDGLGSWKRARRETPRLLGWPGV